MKESMQFAIFDRLKKKEITQAGAAKILGISTRWIRIKLKRYLAQGTQGLVHLNRCRPSSKRWKEEERDFAMQLFEGIFAGFGPTLAAEKLQELYGIKVDKETVRKEMIAAGHWHGKKRKIKHREQRQRKAYYGEMTQVDGSPHDWLEERGPRCTLINFVDDATSLIPFMMFAPNESHDSVMKAFRKYVEINGIPRSLYVDFGGVFSVNKGNPDRIKITQFKRACNELGTEIIYANSPQAKGRVERSHGTHQDRLVKELRLAGIDTIEQANEYIMQKYLPKHNKMFAVEPLKKGDLHSPTAHLKLDNIFCFKDKRNLQNDFTLSYQTRILQLTKNQRAVIRPKESITIHEKLDGALELYIRGIRLDYVELKQKPTKPKEDIIAKDRIYSKPAATHPWRSDFSRIHRSSIPNGGY